MHNNLIHSLILIHTKMSRNEYNSLEIEQKRMICIYNEKHKRITQKQLILHFTKEFQLE